MGTFLKPKTQKMKHLSAKQREECIECVKEEILFFDVDQHVKSSSNKKLDSSSTTALFINVTDFYLNLEIDDEDYANQHGSSKSS